MGIRMGGISQLAGTRGRDYDDPESSLGDSDLT